MTEVDSAKKEIARLVIAEVAKILADMPDPRVREVRALSLPCSGYVNHSTSIDLELPDGSLTIQYSHRTPKEGE